MNYSFNENILDLIDETKKYLDQLDPNSNIILEGNEKSFFKNDLNIICKKLRDLPEKQNVIENKNIYIQKVNKKSIDREKPMLEKPALPTTNTTSKSTKKAALIKKQITTKQSNTNIPKAEFTILEKPQKNEHNIGEIKKIINEVYPSYKLHENIPSDKKARQIAQSWKLKKHATDITILTFRETPQQLLFLKNLTVAIDIVSLPSKIISAKEIEKENGWNIFLSQEDLKLVIACDYSILGLPNLVKHYKEMPETKQHFLQDIPLFMLPDISLYLKEPLLKKSLWASLIKKIQLLTEQ